MIVCIDCFKLVKGTGKSIGIYNLALNLTRNLYRNNMDNNCRLIVFGNQYNAEDYRFMGDDFILVDRNPLNKASCLEWELLTVSSYCRKHHVDRIVFPRGFRPLIIGVKDTVIIHDMIPFYYHIQYPDVFNKLENAYIMSRLRASINGAQQVITISEASRQDIAMIARRDVENIKVIYDGLNHMTIRADKMLVENQRYIIAVTSNLPHKNAKGIIKSYISYCELCEDALPIKIIGIADTGNEFVPQKYKDKIQCYHYIDSDEELHRMIAQASVFLFLSLKEGFGYPPIEAMQLGVPVICSNASALPEVVGNAAVLVNPEDVQQVAKVLMELLADVKKQETLICEGYKNIKRFVWEKQTRLYWEALKE